MDSSSMLNKAMFDSMKRKDPFADPSEEECCEKCLSRCHTTSKHDSVDLENPFADPRDSIQRTDSGIDIESDSIQENERRLLVRFATKTDTPADRDYVLKQLSHGAYDAGYAEGKRKACKKDFNEGYYLGFKSGDHGSDTKKLNRAFEAGQQKGSEETIASERRKWQKMMLEVQRDARRETEERVMERNGFVREPAGGWVKKEIPGVQGSWKKLKGMFKSDKKAKKSCTNSAIVVGEGAWWALEDDTGADAKKKSKSKRGKDRSISSRRDDREWVGDWATTI